MSDLRQIELLSPARDIGTAKEAILHGADAVYIGAPRYSARSAAGNDIVDISTLVEFAHLYRVKVYVALNTIIKDDELEDVSNLIKSLYNIGVDALIIQDMGILELDIPPISLHASTQCNNNSVEKVKFLEQAGFSQVVLARELKLEEIKKISKETTVPLEVFIHGALCVSYSGRCYLSKALYDRSANRGECAQCCRLSYDLVDSDGVTLIKSKHLLSLKDMNRSQSIEQLLDAGVTSLKIEGRLKDVEYVKNITAYYRALLDQIFTRRHEYRRSSSGISSINFEPNPEKSFNRGFTDYYIDNKTYSSVASVNTPKSIGEEIGRVTDVSDGFIVVNTRKELHNGDGFCYTSVDGTFDGFRINRAEANKIYPSAMPKIKAGDTLYRNYDMQFERQLSVNTAERKIYIDAELGYQTDKLTLSYKDEDGNTVSVSDTVLNIAKAKSNQSDNQRKQITKLGGTPYVVRRVDVSRTENLFIPSSILTAIRRKTADALNLERLRNYNVASGVNLSHPDLHTDLLTFESNISNAKSMAFYNSCGVSKIESAYEIEPRENVPLMTTKYCLKREFGQCPKQHPSVKWKEPLYIVNGNNRLKLAFDCILCRMTITK